MILDVIDFDMRIDLAVRSPSVSCLTRSQGLALEFGVSPDSIRMLEARGHEVKLCKPDEILMEQMNGVEMHDGNMYVCEPVRIDGIGGAITRSGKESYYGYHFS